MFCLDARSRSREGAPLGRNQYVELEIKKSKANGASTKLSANQKPCEKTATKTPHPIGCIFDHISDSFRCHDQFASSGL